VSPRRGGLHHNRLPSTLIDRIHRDRGPAKGRRRGFSERDYARLPEHGLTEVVDHVSDPGRRRRGPHVRAEGMTEDIGTCTRTRRPRTVLWSGLSRREIALIVQSFSTRRWTLS
jgi:hypothetical protein